ncbi:serine/threonine protein kinase [Actinomadura nitritigenes]|uniref:Serine/threonine protein kinase n=3 Tax=Actinomadura nitritigenes TaxID=134602 RepID=A0ABS3QTU4_9ACTN|nr:serine/threonine-protein kinase [Actinomadura nitritigenes]MBO2437047.1 serine/threonine protein kinase [Actinomadura nitritigenes]
MTPVAPLRPDDPGRLGRYELLGRLGEGGQSVVYLGRRDDGMHGAVKLLRAQLSRSPEWRARFERELKLIERVAGFCTAQVVDADVSAETPYVVSEYVPGPSLTGLVGERGPRAGTDLDRLAIGTVTALAAIHRAGILHRDFKPSNVLMGPDGPRVIDFGIARLIGESAARGSGVVGTPSYMAPEQVTDAELGTGVDMFTWAATMLFAATGRHPFGNDSISAVFNRILHYEPDLSPLPGTLRGSVAACLAKDPARRPEAQQVLLDLIGRDVPPAPRAGGALTTGAQLAGDRRTPPLPDRFAAAGTGPEPPTPDTVPRPPHRVGRRAALAAVPLAVLAGGGTAWAVLANGSSDAPATASTDQAGPPAAANAAIAPAAEAVRSVLSFDHSSLDRNVAAAHQVSTPRYGADYDRQLAASGYRKELQDKKGSVTTDVVDSAVVGAASGSVTVLSFVKRTVRAEDASPRLLSDPMRATMVRQGNRWLLDTLYTLKAGSQRADTSGLPWPGAQARGALGAVYRDPAVASGTPVELGLRAGGGSQGLTALVAVGDCKGACTDKDPVSFHRLLLRRSGGEWTVASSQRL